MHYFKKMKKCVKNYPAICGYTQGQVSVLAYLDTTILASLPSPPTSNITHTAIREHFQNGSSFQKLDFRPIPPLGSLLTNRLKNHHPPCFFPTPTSCIKGSSLSISFNSPSLSTCCSLPGILSSPLLSCLSPTHLHLLQEALPAPCSFWATTAPRLLHLRTSASEGNCLLFSVSLHNQTSAVRGFLWILHGLA